MLFSLFSCRSGLSPAAAPTLLLLDTPLLAPSFFPVRHMFPSSCAMIFFLIPFSIRSSLPIFLTKKGTAALRPTVPFRHFHPFLAALCPGKNEPVPLPGAAAAFPDSSLPPHPAIRLELAFSAPLLRQYAPAKRLYPLVLRHTLPPFGGSKPALRSSF